MFAIRARDDADTATGLSPDPVARQHDALLPYAVVVPYSNVHLLTSPPLGFTVAFRVAVVWVIEEAALVTTAGGPPAAAS